MVTGHSQHKVFCEHAHDVTQGLHKLLLFLCVFMFADDRIEAVDHHCREAAGRVQRF